jgi:rare lipoprotein A (peptidoglycan hydrolase)
MQLNPTPHNNNKRWFIVDLIPCYWTVIKVFSNNPLSPGKWLSVLPLVALASALVISGCSTDKPGNNSEQQNQQTLKLQSSSDTKTVKKEVGEASWYGPGFHGQETANGETFDQKDLTAAHPSLPMGTKAKVTNLENGKKVEVRINDRGPFSNNRVIDLSSAAAKKLDMKKDGTTEVKIETKATQKKTSAKDKK